MKTCLVFPPQLIPTSAPLGLALLKSFIESGLNEKVKNIDLNLYFHNSVIDNFLEGRFSLYSDKEKNQRSIELIKKSSEIFKDKDNYGFFSPSVYNPCANEFLYLFENIFKANKPLLKGFIEDKADLSQALLPFTKEITKEKPDLVGFSILTIEQIYYALALAKKLKQDINAKIVIGGAAARLFPEKFLGYDFIDFVVKGDGEMALKGLLEGKNKEEINNLIYKKEGKMISNKEQNIDINKMPFPDFSDFDLDDYFCPKRVITTLTSRGCYWKRCTFCADYDALSMQYRTKEISRLIEELRFLKESYKTDYFYFADEMISPVMFKKISDGLIKEGLDIRYYTQLKPKDFDLELLRNMKKSGCTALMWGVESACQRILDLINKGTNVTEIGDILKRSNQAGIKNAVYAFGGFPTETEQEYNSTIEWLNENRAYIDIQFTGLFRLTKNSRIEKDLSGFKIASINASDDAFNPAYDYGVKEGISQQRSSELFDKNYTFFLGLNKFSPFLGKFRDHILVYFSENEARNQPMHDS
ncbi:B12-binding domain-containing radical SAM protein [Candidatus Woesearchaeota archaeon]|nr:B12-binding domain-containing radical SAM protein [Candidatus Woesearchaeota archaeon]